MYSVVEKIIAKILEAFINVKNTFLEITFYGRAIVVAGMIV
jgi:hypothetical protein